LRRRDVPVGAIAVNACRSLGRSAGRAASFNSVSVATTARGFSADEPLSRQRLLVGAGETAF
jgi:hypothetical protein